MSLKQYSFSFEEFNNINALSQKDALLLKKAKFITKQAYAPYSKFYVGAAAHLINGEIITATNQENASFPAGICAERVLLSAISSLHPKTKVETIAISYNNRNGKSNHPITPCGICRQSLAEYEKRTKHPIRLLLSGITGKILVFDSALLLLPLCFNASDLL